MPPVERARSSLLRWLAGSADDDVLRWLYRGLLLGAIAVLALDFQRMQTVAAQKSAALAPAEQPAPVGPADAKLRNAMTFDLIGDGRLIVSGTITPGTAQAFAAEIDKRGSYVKTIVLQSPGGSVQDAIAMGRLIRVRKFSTEVAAGRICVSSCPLVFAGGIERHAGKRAEIGVHQFVAATAPREMTPSEAMADTQRLTATVQSYLREMGVDLAVWVRAMETPNSGLYKFSPAELLELKLATDAGTNVTPRGRARS
jgi:hypothetical protein